MQDRSAVHLMVFAGFFARQSDARMSTQASPLTTIQSF